MVLLIPLNLPGRSARRRARRAGRGQLTPCRAEAFQEPRLRLALVEQRFLVDGALGADSDPELAAPADDAFLFLGRPWLVSHAGPGDPAASDLRRPGRPLRSGEPERVATGAGRPP